MTPEQRAALRSTVADLIGRTVDTWNGYNRQRPALFAEIASRLDAAGLVQSPESAAELKRLRARASAAPVALPAEQREAIGLQLGDAKPAQDGLVAQLAESVRDVREHEHPKREDLYCSNLTGWVGERMAPVLRRLLDAEAEAAQLRTQVAEMVGIATAGRVRLLGDVDEIKHLRAVADAQLSRADTLNRLTREQRARADKAEARVTELEAANAGLDDLRLWAFAKNDQLREHLATLEDAPLAWANELDLKSLDNFLISLATATDYEPMDGAIGRIHEVIREFRAAASTAREETEGGDAR